MKIYFSKKEVCFPWSDGMRRFALAGASGYYYTARSHAEENYIESLPMFKRGQIVVRGETSPAPKPEPAVVEKPKTEETKKEVNGDGVEAIRGISKCSDAIQWLKARYVDADQVRTRADIHEFAFKKKIDFVDLAK